MRCKTCRQIRRQLANRQNCQKSEAFFRDYCLARPPTPAASALGSDLLNSALRLEKNNGPAALFAGQERER